MLLQEAAWTLAATKQGEEATRQGVVSGTISIANGRPQQAAVYGVLVAVKGGPSAEVSCGPSFPFKVPACSTVVCTYTARYPQLPAPGSYQVASSVQFQQQGDKAGASVGVAEAASGFEVRLLGCMRVRMCVRGRAELLLGIQPAACWLDRDGGRRGGSEEACVFQLSRETPGAACRWRAL